MPRNAGRNTSGLGDAVFKSRTLQTAITIVIYAFYACILGGSLVPSAGVVLWAHGLLFAAGKPAAAGRVAVFCLVLGAAFFTFLFCALLLIALVVRTLSLSVKPGRHPIASPTGLTWMTLNGIHTIAFRLFLPLVPGTFFTRTYFRLAGCRLGKNVWLTTPYLLDPYMISIGDDTIVGGDAILTAHVFENETVFISLITIGKGCTIGAHALICPGVTIEDRAIVGMRAFIRVGVRVAEGRRVSSIAGLDPSRVWGIERGVLPQSAPRPRSMQPSRASRKERHE